MNSLGPEDFARITPESSNNSTEPNGLTSDVPIGGVFPAVDHFPTHKPTDTEASGEISSGLRESAIGGDTAGAGDSAKKRPVSVPKIEANRRNSKKSPGPTSLAGKNKVRWNSLKHGLLVKALFMGSISGEEKAAFFRFFKALRRDLQPVGMLEETHIEGAAVSYWLIQRSLRSESGEIRRGQLMLKSPKGGDFAAFLISPELAEIDDHLSIPNGQALDRILRYRTAAHKDLSYHLAELGRLQRSRKGDHVSPPIHVQVQ